MLNSDTNSRAVIFANGEPEDREAVRALLRPADRLIAADGGARHCLALGLTPHHVVGDLDSLTPAEVAALRQAGVRLHPHPAAKDETDLELALSLAVETGAADILVLGALGGRLDMLLANVLLLAHPALAAARVTLWSARQTTWLIRPPGADIPGRPGDTLSLIPLAGAAHGVVTHGLAYPLRRETLTSGPARGVSNVLTGEPARVELETGLLWATLTSGRA